MCEALTKQYEDGNEKLYLKQKYDTASLFSITQRLYHTMASFDSIDAMPDARGRIRPKYREKHASFLNSIRPNLFNGGVFLMHKKIIRLPIPTLMIISCVPINPYFMSITTWMMTL